MSRVRHVGLVVSIVASLMAVAGPAHGQEEDPAQLWADFNHYVLVARLDLANSAGQALLDRVDNQRLLEIVEQSNYADQYQQVLDRARRNDTTESVAEQLRQRISEARIANARDEQRIERNIELLDDGSRPYKNAVERLTAAGQFAAPQLLATLRDPEKESLHPYVLNAMVAIGEPVLPPLAQALNDVEPVLQGQLAQVFARIGHPYPGPMLKQLAQNEDADPTAREKARRAYRRLRQTANLPAERSAARLYLMRGEAEYNTATNQRTELPGFDQAKGDGIVWEFDSQAGLIDIAVPGVIFGDVLAMRSAKEALALNGSLKEALSLYLMANLRRQNRLPEGESDPSYEQAMRPPSFYARVAGPERLHDVLTRALNDTDPALALDAIEALSKTAGTDALVRRGASRQPLVRAMSYPDQRVRFRAAEALANARPKQSFPAAARVVPVLAEPARPEQTNYAAVLANTQERRNELLGVLNEMGYDAFAGQTISDIQNDVANQAGVDLIVIDQSIGSVTQIANQTRKSLLLAGAPLLALADPGDQARLESMFKNEPRVQSAVAGDNQAIQSAIESALSAYEGTQLSEDQRESFAVEGLKLLRQLALAESVYAVTDVQPVLIDALDDERDAVAQQAARVVAVLDTQKAQRALANHGLTEERTSVKVALLESLAESATHFGNRLNRSQQARINTLVGESTGEVAVAAGEAHGALQLPAKQAVKLIVSPGD